MEKQGKPPVREAAVAVIVRSMGRDLDPQHHPNPGASFSQQHRTFDSKGDIPGLELLVIERARHPNDPWSGHMAFPGGKRELQDHSLRATAERETLEELDIDLKAEAVWLCDLPKVETLRTSPSTGSPVSVSPHLYYLRNDISMKRSDEVHATFWLSLTQLFDKSTEFRYETVLHGKRRRLPARAVQGKVIWGLSYRILNQLHLRLIAKKTC